MVSSGSVVGVALVALGMVLTPGPNMMYLLSRSITQGRRAGLISLGGVAVGFVCYLFLAAYGLSAVFTAVPGLYATVKLTGAAYLGWLAYNALRPGGTSVFTERALPADSPRRLFTMGLLTNLLNPKAALMYAGLIPQFLNPHAGHLLAQSLLLGGVQIAVSMTVNTALILTAGTIAVFLNRRPNWLRVQRYITGSALGLIAVKLATDRTRPIST